MPDTQQESFGLLAPSEQRAIRLAALAREAGRLCAEVDADTGQGAATYSGLCWAIRDRYHEERRDNAR